MSNFRSFLSGYGNFDQNRPKKAILVFPRTCGLQRCCRPFLAGQSRLASKMGPVNFWLEIVSIFGQIFKNEPFLIIFWLFLVKKRLALQVSLFTKVKLARQGTFGQKKPKMGFMVLLGEISGEISPSKTLNTFFGQKWSQKEFFFGQK